MGRVDLTIANIVLGFIVLFLPPILSSLFGKKEGKEDKKKEASFIVLGAIISFVYIVFDLFVLKFMLLSPCGDLCGVEDFLAGFVSFVWLIVGGATYSFNKKGFLSYYGD